MRKQDIPLVIVDDNLENLKSLQELLSFDPHLKIQKLFSSADQFFKYMETCPLENRPEIVLSDIDMPQMNGINMVLIAKAKYPLLKFIMISVHDDEHFLFDAIKAGASGYLLKDDSIKSMIEQIKTLCYEEGAPMSPVIARKTLEMIQRLGSVNSTKPMHQLPDLSERELEVLRSMVEGHNYDQIASLLFITKNTVKKHISNIYNKLHVTSKAQAIKVANFNGLV